MWQDLRYSLRTLRHSRGFALTALFVLALGIGINTAIFSVIYAVLFQPPAVRAAHELRYIYSTGRFATLLYTDYRYLRDSNDVFADLVAVASATASVRNAPGIAGESVSANYFDVLGVQPVIGRSFRSEDEQSNAGRVVIISEQMWLRQFNADPAILGRNLRLTRPGIRPTDQWSDYTIVGVMGPAFHGVASPWQPTQFWVPIVQRESDYRRPSLPQSPVYRSLPPQSWGLSLIVGRLKSAESEAPAQVVVQTLGQQLKHPLRTDAADWGLVVHDARRVQLPFDSGRQIVPERLAMGLMTVAGLVLLIATANLAGLLMARGVTRRSEIAVRLTLGASRWRIARQLLSEGLVLSVAGGGLGILLARALVVVFVDQTPTQFGRFSGGRYALDIPLNLTVVIFTAGLCIIAGLLVGLAPARQASKTDLLTALGGTAQNASRRTDRLRHWIVVPQVCLSLVLLLVAGALGRPLLRAELTSPGYEPDGLVFAEFGLSPYQRMSTGETKQYSDRRESLHTRIRERLSNLPGMPKAALAFTLPFDPMQSWVVDRDQYPAGRHWLVAQAAVSPEYFEVLGMSVLRGRAFDARDRKDSTPVAVVCQRFAQWLWPGETPVGRYFGLHSPNSKNPPTWTEVIGIVNEVQPPLSDGAANPAFYTPLDQGDHPYATAIVARGRESQGTLERALRQAVIDSDDAVEIQRSGTVGETIAAMRYPRRVAVGILSLSGVMGLILASMGIYGVVSYSVAQRLREIGIRAALGARQAQLIRLVILDGVRVVAIGSVLGLVGAFAAFRLASKLVVALPALDAATLLVVPIVLASVILAACYVPARRAGSVDPITVLRNL